MNNDNATGVIFRVLINFRCRMLGIIWVFVTCFLAPLPAISEQFDLKEMILFERDEYIFVDVEKFALTLREAKQHTEITSMIDEIFSPFFEFKYLTEPPTAHMALNYIPAEFKGAIVIAIGPSHDIRTSRPLRSVTTLSGSFDIVEFGNPLEKWFSSSWDRERHMHRGGTIFTHQVVPTTCSSFFNSHYFEKPSGQKVNTKLAIFFVEGGEHEAACVKSLFLDLLGLRGLAVDIDVSQDVIEIGLAELLSLEAGASFKK